MTITKLSSYAVYANQVRTITQQQRDINDLSAQMSTGKKSLDVAHFGMDAQRLLDLKSSFARHQGYQNAISHVTPRIQAYDKILERMNTLLTDLTSTTRIPPGPGTPRISAVTNANNNTLRVSVNDTQSRLNTTATYTVTAVPSTNGPQGSFDVTITDGLGGRATNTINLKQIPPQVDHDRFIISGGPGDGAIVKLDIHQLNGPGSSSFNVDFPEITASRVLVQGAITEVEALLNERLGDRYLFSGSRFDTKPVGDITAAKQVTRVTLTGQRGDEGEVYEMILNGRRFTYTTTGTERSHEEVLTNTAGTGLVDQILNANPPFNVTASVHNGIVTFTGNNVGDKFTLRTQVYDNATYVNAATDPVVTTPANATTQEVQQLTLIGGPAGGVNADIGDTYTITLGARTIVQNPGAPEQVIIAGPEKYAYVLSSEDMDIVRGITPPPAGFVAPTSAMNWVAQRLAAQITNDPSSPVTAAVSPAPDDTRLVFTARNVNQTFETTVTVNNAGNRNQLITNTLPPLAGQESFEREARDPDLPFYDSQFGRQAQQASAWDIARVNGDDDLRVSYGVTSTDPAVQKLISGLRRARAAVENPGQYEKLMAEARDLLGQAQTGLRQIQSRVVNAHALLNSANERHTDSMNRLTTEIAGIEGIDENEVAAKLRQAMTTQEANYTITGRIAQLSLVNFLA